MNGTDLSQAMGRSRRVGKGIENRLDSGEANPTCGAAPKRELAADGFRHTREGAGTEWHEDSVPHPDQQINSAEVVCFAAGSGKRMASGVCAK
jgi:hypothetical protein